MLQNMKIGSRLYLLVGVLSVLLLFTGMFGFLGMKEANQSIKTLYDDRTVCLGQLDAMAKANLRIRVNIANILLFPTASEIASRKEKINSEIETIATIWKEYTATYLTGEEKTLVGKTQDDRRRYREEAIFPVMKMIDTGKIEEAKQFFNATFHERYNEVEKDWNDLIKLQIDVAKEVNSSYDHEYSRNTLLLSVFVLLGITGGVLFAWFTIRGITRPLDHCVAFAKEIEHGNLTANVEVTGKDETALLTTALLSMRDNLSTTITQILNATNTVATASEELSATTDELARGAREQTSQTEQAATATTEMSQTILDVAKNAGEAAEAAKESSRMGGQGKKIMDDTAVGMGRIAETVSDLSGVIRELSASSQQIGNIISVINDIADQTNLLALNAAIEAARAGEQGRGFAVVADEVRKLAERTGTATKEIASMIQKIQAETEKSSKSMQAGAVEVSKGVALAEDAKESMDKILAASDKGLDMVQRIATASEEQSAAAEEVSASMESIANVTRSTLSAAEEIRSATQNLAQMASELRQATDFFQIASGETKSKGAKTPSRRRIGR